MIEDLFYIPDFMLRAKVERRARHIADERTRNAAEAGAESPLDWRDFEAAARQELFEEEFSDGQVTCRAQAAAPAPRHRSRSAA